MQGSHKEGKIEQSLQVDWGRCGWEREGSRSEGREKYGKKQNGIGRLFGGEVEI